MARFNLFAGVCGVALIAAAFPVSARTLEEAFAHPSVDAKPRVRWWWPGAAVDDAELKREIALLDENGFGGGEIQSLTPNFVSLTPGESAIVNNYAEPDFFDHVRVAGEAAKARGMTLDYTLGSSWPSGGGFAIPPEKALVELTMSRTSVKGGVTGPIKVEIPARTKRLGALSSLDARTTDPKVADWGVRLDARAKIVAVVAMKGTDPVVQPTGPASMFKLFPWSDVTTSGTVDFSSNVVLTDHLRSDGTLDWTPPPGNWQVFVFKQYASNMGVLGAAGQGPQLVLDHLDPAAFAAHVARVGDPLGKNPPGIRSTFVDSLELMQDIPWTPTFLAQFRKLRGYDLTPYLPFVVQPGWMQAWDEHFSLPYFAGGDLGERVRADYRRTVSDLLFTGFIDPFVAWNHAHGIKAKFQAHGGAIDIVRGYGVVDIPETEDLVHNGDPYVIRFARSGADLYGRSVVSAESLVWKDRPYDVTPDEMRKRADLLFAGGVNSMIMHGMDYRFHASDWPGWHTFQPSPFALGFSSMLTESNPIWSAMKPLAAYIGRTQAVLQEGKPVVPVAYFYGQTGYYVGIEDGGAGAQSAEKTLISGGYDYDRINPESIAAAYVERRQLVAKSGARYATLVLPPIDGIRAETAEKIAGFAKQGLPVFFTDHAPSRDEGVNDAARRDVRVKNAMAAAFSAGAKTVSLGSIVSALHAAAVPENLTFTGADTSGLVFVQRQAGSRTVTFIHNLMNVSRDAGFVLPTKGGITRWDAMTGRIATVSSMPEKAGTGVPLLLGAGETALLVQDVDAPSVVVPSRVAVGNIALDKGWTLTVDGHAGRKPFAQDIGSFPLKDWRNVPALANFAGLGVYHQRIDIPVLWLAKGVSISLDLGSVYDMATVSVNGRLLAPAITAPFRVDLTGVVKGGPNDLVITIANTLNNSMIDPKAAGYKMLKPTGAGLIGPVVLAAER